jgi:serine/threonine protein kinase
MNIELKPNQIIDNRYKIIKKLDEGGMGEVWKATDSRTNDSIVVLKFPLKHQDPEILERFAREAGTMRELAGDCDNILDIQDIGSIAVNDIDNVPYYVMRFQTGGALRDWKVPEDDLGKPALTRESLSWVTGTATALDFLHHQTVPVFHRDVKPENILFNASGAPKLSDFGIVKNIKKATTNITRTGAAMGTVAYMPPEIWRGGDFSPASDQFSFASTVYEMIAGKRPYDGSTPFAMLESLSKGHEKLETIIGLSAASSEAVDKALSHEPDDRFPSCGEFAKVFLQNLRTEEIHPPKPSEMATGIHAEMDSGAVGGSVVHGGKPIVAKAPAVDSPIAVEKPILAPPVKPVPLPKQPKPVSSGGFTKSARLGVAALLLSGFIGGVFYLSGAFSGSGSSSPTDSATSLSDFSLTNVDVELSYDEYQECSNSVLEEHADYGHAIAQDVLGDRFSSGEEGFEKNDTTAVYWYRKAADQGNRYAQFSLSRKYAYGDGVEQDKAEAAALLRKAAEQGDGNSQYFLASAYEDGMGVEVDGEEAVYWYTKCSEQGENDRIASAQLQLGEIFEEGIIVDQDLFESRRWFRRAVESGSLTAPKRLEFGVGEQAPSLAGKDAEGVSFELSDYRGKIIWLSFYTRH